LFKLLYDPVAVIKETKTEGFPKILLVLIAASLFATAGLLFLSWRFMPFAVHQNLIVLGIVAVLFGCIISHLVAAFFFSLVMHVLDGQGGYFEGLATLVLSMVAPAVSLFFAGAISFLPYGLIIGLLLLTYGYSIGTATLFRAAKEFFGLDYTGVLIGFLITALVLSSAVSVAFIL